MIIDRGALARVDRRILSKLNGEGGPKLVKLPVSDAVWDVWRRYCRLAGVTMGEGLAILLAHEMATEIEDVAPVDHVLSGRVALHITELRETVEEQKRRLHAAGDQLKQREEQIRSLQQQLRAVQDELAAWASRAAPSPQRVGRNERCPCGSGLKHKFCEALNHRLSGG